MGNCNCKICKLPNEDIINEALVDKTGNQIKIYIGPNYIRHNENKIVSKTIKRATLITDDIKDYKITAFGSRADTLEHKDSMMSSLNDNKISCVISNYRPSLTIENVFAEKNQCLALYKMLRENEEISEIAYIDSVLRTSIILYNIVKMSKIIKKKAHDDKIYMIKHYYYNEMGRNLLLTASCDRSIKIWIVEEDALTENLCIKNCHDGSENNYFALLIDEGIMYVTGGNKGDKINIWNSKGDKIHTVHESTLQYVNYIEIGNIIFPEQENSAILAGFPCCESYNYSNSEIKVFKDKSVRSYNCTCALIGTINGINNLVCGDTLGIFRVFAYFTKELIHKIDVGMSCLDVAQFNENYLLLSGELKRLKIIDTTKFNVMFKSNNSHQDFITNIRVLLNKDENVFFVTVGKDGKIEVWFD